MEVLPTDGRAGEPIGVFAVHLRGRMWDVGRKAGNDAAVLLSVNVADAAEVASFSVIVLQKNLIGLCIVYESLSFI